MDAITNDKELQLQKFMIGPNGRPMAALVGQQLTLLGKWPMADHYIVLCVYGKTLKGITKIK